MIFDVFISSKDKNTFLFIQLIWAWMNLDFQSFKCLAWMFLKKQSVKRAYWIKALECNRILFIHFAKESFWKRGNYCTNHEFIANTLALWHQNLRAREKKVYSVVYVKLYNPINDERNTDTIIVLLSQQNTFQESVFSMKPTKSHQ